MLWSISLLSGYVSQLPFSLTRLTSFASCCYASSCVPFPFPFASHPFVLESATVFEHLPVRSFHHRSVGACIHIGEFLYQFRKNDDVVILGLTPFWPTTFSKENDGREIE